MYNPGGKNPHNIVFHPTDDLAFVTLQGEDKIAVIDSNIEVRFLTMVIVTTRPKNINICIIINSSMCVLISQSLLRIKPKF